jgi:multidrug resistance efflux pump
MLKYQEMRARVDRMSLKSPNAGTIDTIEIEEGEAVNALDPILRVVLTDPLWIDVPVPLPQARTFKVGQTAAVAFPSGNETASGKIIYVSTVADAASSTLRVRIEVPNKKKRPAGEHAQVSFLKSANPVIIKPVK